MRGQLGASVQMAKAGAALCGGAPNIYAVIPGRRGSGEPGIHTTSPLAPPPGFRVRAKEDARPGMTVLN
jgi:hypothetical protein